jgi:hypothetical protein
MDGDLAKGIRNGLLLSAMFWAVVVWVAVRLW